MYAGGCTYLCSQPLTEQTVQKRPCGEGNTLFGPHAKFALQNSPPAVEDEAELIKSIRARLGPYASGTALLYHLRAARGKVFWAVNTYFRAVLAEQVNQADFEPREYAQLANYQAPTAPKCTQHPLTTEQMNLENIPSLVVEHMLQHTNLFTVCSAALASRSLGKAAQSNTVWASLYNKRWGCAQLDQQSNFCHAASNQQVEQSQWHDKYQQRHLAEQRMQCPSCEQSKVVPIVYGFPSHLLVRNMRANKLRMGNDHLIEGQPIWTCTACTKEFADFPFPSMELSVPDG